jgi:diguanylate cyclase (GGDEF)-like protein
MRASDITARSRFETFSLPAGAALVTLAVAALVAAILLVWGKISPLQTPEVRKLRAPLPVIAKPADPAPAVEAAAAPASMRSPFPSAEPLLRAMDRLDRAVDESAEGDITELGMRYPKLEAELDRRAAEFSAAATAAGEAPPAKFKAVVRSHEQLGANLIELEASRRVPMADYASHSRQLNERVRKSLDHPGNIFGRADARQSSAKIAGDLDDLRRRSAEFVSADTVDSTAYDTLGASQGQLAQTLAQNHDAFTRVEGKDWYEKTEGDLQAMSAARKALLQIDRQRKDAARKFGADSAFVAQIVEHLAQTETYVARPAASNGGQAPAEPSGEPAPSQPSGGQWLGSGSGQWLSGGGLLIIFCLSVFFLSAGAALSLVWPLRRLVNAATRIAEGEGRMAIARSGIRELDTLALAVNDMAGQLTLAREAQDRRQLLEAAATERTLQLQELARLDPLTRLANRHHFFALLNAAIDAAIRENRRVGVFFLDVDHFKNMNDNLGHEFGDRVLQAIATRLSEITHSYGFAARLGGDEFIVVYESASGIDDVRVAGLQLIKAFQEPLPVDGRELVVTLSAGASAFPDHASDAEALLRAADAALYRAKALGRSQLATFTPEQLEAAAARFAIEEGLRRALDRGEFTLVFQPQVNLQTFRIELVEALLRWHQPNGRYASPQEFLAVADASGLILQINDWVLRRAIETAARWHHGPWPETRVAINVSSRQLFDSGLVDQVLELLEQHDLPSRCIEIELTESVLQTGRAAIESLHRLRAHGIAIALDDFGTGFSSLAALQQLPLTRIKLDRDLVASIDNSARSAAVGKAIIQLCRSLGMSITAEGIERPEQLTPLVGHAGLYAQGYLLAHPVPEDELLTVMATLPALTQALVSSSVARLPDARLAENLAGVTSVLEP